MSIGSAESVDSILDLQHKGISKQDDIALLIPKIFVFGGRDSSSIRDRHAMCGLAQAISKGTHYE